MISFDKGELQYCKPDPISFLNHSIEYVRYNVHTNSIEAFWSNVKRSISGTHVWVSKKHLQTYLCEFEYRYNLRKEPELMMDALLKSFPWI